MILVGNVIVFVCWEDCICLSPLRLELEAKTNLVSAGVDVLAIEESRQRQLDACRNTHTDES